MHYKIYVPLVFILVMVGYFISNPSYEKSLQAKYYYETAQYKEAYNLAKEAFGMDVYNRMASTIMAQSTTSLKYVNFINEAKNYQEAINKIALHDSISDADRAKIKMICKIMIAEYKKLAPSVVTDKELQIQSAKYNNEFEKLLEKVTQ